ncbi:DUF6646 family protein [Flavobacterium sp.]|jgi:hypothetical protein|uniref:DUF6646 family protein n=1 Tax=Flavobacterium sp. TaxID=239 RepID=UPI002606E258|nr:DUF6646 family protein [Flavobacterium sp.]
MKQIVLGTALFLSFFIQAQAFKGKGDLKGQIGATFQDAANGIAVTADYGVGENISVGLMASYLLNANRYLIAKPRFEDRSDIRLRFNANIGNVFKLDPNWDVYPGLSLGFRNFGGHLGARYFFTNGFGLYTEFSVPLSRYDTDVNGYEHYNNQFMLNIGASFTL